MVTSILNPNAPMFVPLAYRAVEDFSDQWWELVQASPWFRDYWLHECFSDPQIDSISPFLDIAADDATAKQEGEAAAAARMDLVAVASLKWRNAARGAELARYCEKPPKFVSKSVKPRPIQQPR